MKLNGTATPIRELSVDDIMRSTLWKALPVWSPWSSPKPSTVWRTHWVCRWMWETTGETQKRIHSPKLQASASEQVTDLLNGCYRVHFHLFWPGDVLVSVILVHSSEAVGILRRISAHNYDKITYTGTFFSGKKGGISVQRPAQIRQAPLRVQEEGRCGVLHLRPTKNPSLQQSEDHALRNWPNS